VGLQAQPSAGLGAGGVVDDRPVLPARRQDRRREADALGRDPEREVEGRQLACGAVDGVGLADIGVITEADVELDRPDRFVGSSASS
jgi:hypothetical protein